MKSISPFGIRLGLAAALLSLELCSLTASAAPATINIDFGAGLVGSAKVGLAATGQTASDFWNFYTRDDGAGGWRTFGVVSNLKTADGTATSASLTVANAPGAWGNGSSDPMYVGYIYPFDGNATATLTNLAAGQYDVYLYASDGKYQLVAGGVDYGVKACQDVALVNPPVWQEGVQYARFGNVTVNAGQPVVVTVQPGVSGYAIISGMQLVKTGELPPPAPAFLVDVDFGEGQLGSAKVGLAATGQSASDFWNFYTRDDGAGGWRTFGAVSNLKTSDGTTTAAGLTVANAPGSWGNGSSDAMYVGYIYPLSGENATVTLTNLAAGQYDVYLYANDGKYQLAAGAVNYGVKTCQDVALASPPVWQEGVQYARFGNVTVNAGQPVVITVQPGVLYGYAIISGMQIARVGAVTGTPPALVTQPTSQTVFAGANVTFSASATGTDPLSFQWRLNGTNIVGATGTSLVRSNVQAADAGNYSVQVTNASGTATSTNAALVVVQPTTHALLNVDFGEGFLGSAKVGVAATGQSASDFWNFYTRDDGAGGWRTFGVVSNLKTADGTVTAAGLTVANAPGSWGNGSSDAMYVGYIYPLSGVNATVTLTNLGAGQYDVYLYANDGKYQLAVGGVDYGVKTCQDVALVNPPVWQEGVQYARFGNVTVNPGQPMVITVQPGVLYGYAIISGMQLVKTGELPPPPPASLVNVDFGEGLLGSAKIGLAATGQSASDFWNFYTRDDGAGGWRTFGAVSNLKTSDGTTTAAGLTVANAPGSWGNGSSDPMYVGYIYPFDGNATVTLTNLSAGQYDFYVYANDGNYQLAVGGVDYGVKACQDVALVNPPVWQEGVQYARFGNVTVNAGQPVVITVRPGVFGYAIISGMQIARVSGSSGTAPSIVTQPASQAVVAGANVTFTVAAAGTAPLSYQWRRNETNLAGATGTSLTLSNVQPANAGGYSVRVTNAFGVATSSNAVLTVNPSGSNAPVSLINVNFGGHLTPALSTNKVGPAAVGQAANDLWNFYSRDIAFGQWRQDGALVNLQAADGTLTAAGLVVNNAPGGWNNGSSDAMYNTYIYPFSGNATVTLTNLSAGQYDFYVYANDGNYQLAVGGVDYGVKTCLDVALTSPPVWQEGVQYARFGNVTVNAGQAVVITVRPGVYGYAIISGMQVARVSGSSDTAPWIVTQPASQAVGAGANVTFTVSAAGPAPLSYQWRRDETNLAGATGTSLTLSNVQPANAGGYSVRVTNAFGVAISSNAVLTVNPSGSNAPVGLINVNFGGHLTPALSTNKVGQAAVGQAANDLWNFYSRDIAFGQWRQDGALVNLQAADGTLTAAGLVVNNAPGGWNNGSSDAMYNTYIYPFSGNATVTLTNLSAGEYDFYVYANDGNYQLAVGGVDYGVKTCLDVALASPPVWQEGVQYARFGNVTVNAGQAVVITVRPGVYGYAIISGLQIASATPLANHPPVADATATLPLVISPNNTNATVVLDGSRSSDPDGDPLKYVWFANSTPQAVATGVVSIVTLPLGTNTATLVVDDGLATSTNQIKVEVITASQAADRLAQAVASGVSRSRPLIATLSIAIAAIDRGNPQLAINQLQAFQQKVQTQVAPLDPAIAAQFIRSAQDVIDALIGSAPAGATPVRIHNAKRQKDGKFQMQLSAMPGRFYIVEASTDLVHWEAIGVARQTGGNEFDFEDANAIQFTGRFYRVVSP